MKRACNCITHRRLDGFLHILGCLKPVDLAMASSGCRFKQGVSHTAGDASSGAGSTLATVPASDLQIYSTIECAHM